MEWIKFGLTAVLIIVYAAYLIKLDIDAISSENHDREEFEQRRAQRQKEFDKHAQAVARACLIDTCETIYLGRADHE